MSLEAVSPEQVQVFNEPAAYYDRVRCILGNGGPSVFWGGATAGIPFFLFSHLWFYSSLIFNMTYQNCFHLRSSERAA